MRSSKSNALAEASERVYCRKISTNMASAGSLKFAVRANVSASDSSFLSFEMRPDTDETVKPSVSASSCLMIRLMSTRLSAES